MFQAVLNYLTKPPSEMLVFAGIILVSIM